MVKRYGLDPTYRVDIIEDPEGDFVDVADYDALAALMREVRPMIGAYRRKHERAYKAAERRFHTEYMEFNAEVVGKCDRILAALDAMGINAQTGDERE